MKKHGMQTGKHYSTLLFRDVSGRYVWCPTFMTVEHVPPRKKYGTIILYLTSKNNNRVGALGALLAYMSDLLNRKTDGKE